MVSLIINNKKLKLNPLFDMEHIYGNLLVLFIPFRFAARI